MLQDEDLVKAAIADPAESGLPDAERALLAFVDKVNRQAHSIGESDIDLVRAAGWSAAAIYQAIAVCALFNFYNRWVDANGVRPMTADQHRAHARRTAKAGYLRTPEG